MAIFKKRETYNEQMLREAGLDRVRFNTPPPPESPPSDQEPAGPVSIRRSASSGVPAGWDTATTAHVPGVKGDSIRFTVLPSGDLIVVEEDGDADLSPLADAIEEHISPPYAARGSRQDGDLWGVAAKRIEVETIPFPDAESLDLSQVDGIAELHVDGEATDAAPPVELQRLGERVGGDFSVQATRIDGDDWEVKVSPL